MFAKFLDLALPGLVPKNSITSFPGFIYSSKVIKLVKRNDQYLISVLPGANWKSHEEHRALRGFTKTPTKPKSQQCPGYWCREGYPIHDPQIPGIDR